MKLALWIPGEPATKGSTIPFRTKEGKLVVRPDNKRLRSWATSVTLLSRLAMQRQGLTPRPGEAAIPRGPVRLDLEFYLPRPKSHFINGDGVRLKPSAPKWHDKQPDYDKLERAVGDALVKAGIVGDDGQFAIGRKAKLWADPMRGPGVHIVLEAMGEEG